MFKRKKPEFKNKTQRILHEIWVTGILVLIVLAFRSTVASTYRVPTGSMIPTILPGDHFFASQMTYNFRIPFTDTSLNDYDPPKLGDIVVFPSPIEPDINLVKRVVAVGGDTIEVRDGRVIRNGEEIPLEEIRPEDPKPPAQPEDGEYRVYWERLGESRHFVQFDRYGGNLRTMAPITLAADEFFPMGDNRDHSADGRIFGPVSIKSLRARAWRIFFSIHSTFPFLRWERTGQNMYP